MSFLKERIELEAAEVEFAAEKALFRLSPLLRWALIICALSLIPAFFLTRFLSHKYWQARYEGSLASAKPSFTDPRAPKIVSISLASSGAGNYSAVAEVQNENIELASDRVPYAFNFYNGKGELVHTVEDSTYLLPNQKKYIVVPKFSASETVKSATLDIPEGLQWKNRLQVPTVKLNALTPQTYNQADPVAFVAEGVLENNSPYLIKQVHLVFLLYNSSGKIIGVSQRDEFTVRPQERRAYKQLWPGIYSNEVQKAKVFAETNALDNANLSVPDPGYGRESDLSRPDPDPYY